MVVVQMELVFFQFFLRSQSNNYSFCFFVVFIKNIFCSCFNFLCLFLLLVLLFLMDNYVLQNIHITSSVTLYHKLYDFTLYSSTCHALLLLMTSPGKNQHIPYYPVPIVVYTHAEHIVYYTIIV